MHTDVFVASASQEHRTFQNLRQGGGGTEGEIAAVPLQDEHCIDTRIPDAGETRNTLVKSRYLDGEARIGGLKAAREKVAELVEEGENHFNGPTFA